MRRTLLALRLLAASVARGSRSAARHARSRRRRRLHRRREAALSRSRALRSPRAAAAIRSTRKLEKVVDRALQGDQRASSTTFRDRVLREGPRVVRRRSSRRTSPKTVVYPFGGGDLLSALVAFPDATEITTISLELAGDPRRLKTLTPKQRRAQPRRRCAREIGGLISVGSNTSENLSNGQRNDLPGAGQLVPARPRRRRLRAGRRCATSRSTTPATIHYLDAGRDRRARRRGEARREGSEGAKLDPEYKATSHLKARLAVAELLARVLQRRDPVPQDRRDRRSACIATSAGTSATTT